MSVNLEQIRQDTLEIIRLKNINTGDKLSFEKMYSQIEEILKIQDQQEMEDAIVNFATNWIMIYGGDLLGRRSIFESSRIIGEKYKNHPAMGVSISEISLTIKGLTKNLITLVDPEYGKSFLMNERQLKAIHDFQIATLRSYSYYQEIPRALKEWNYKAYNVDIEDIKSFFRINDPEEPLHVFRGDLKNQQDVGAAEYYYKSTLIKQELESHGWRWHIKNFLKVIAMKSYLKKVDSAFKKIGFDPAQHADIAKRLLQQSVMPPHDRDMENVDDELKGGISQYKSATLVKTTVATEKSNRALELDKNPETSFEKLLEPYVKKYNLPDRYKEIRPYVNNIQDAAREYDEEKRVDRCIDLLRSRFSNSFTMMVETAIRTGKEIDFTEAFVDARKIAVMTIQRYTSLFEVDELSKMEKPIYMKFITEEWIKGRIDFYVDKAKDEWDEIEENARKNGESVPDYIQKAREAVTPEKIEAMKLKAAEAVKEWRSDIDKIMREDIEFAESLGSNIPVAVKEGLGMATQNVGERYEARFMLELELAEIKEEDEFEIEPPKQDSKEEIKSNPIVK